MALPLDAMGSLGRKPIQVPAWSGRLLLFCFVVFLVTVGSFVGLRFGYKPYLDGRVAALDTEIERFSQEIPASQQAELIQFYSQLANTKALLVRRTAPSSVLSFIQSATLPGVWFTKFAYQDTTRQLTLSGAARTFADVGLQMKAFEQQPTVRQAMVQTITIDPTYGWVFDATVTLASSTASEASSSLPLSSPSSSSSSSPQ
jgi:hypothetical protein